METCERCRFFDNDPASLEAQLPGIRAFGSAYGSTMGRAGICQKSTRLMDPIPVERCGDYEARAEGATEVGIRGNRRAR